MLGFVSFKFFPTWAASLLVRTGLITRVFKYFQLSSRTLDDVLCELTQDPELRAVLGYCFGDFGTLPKETSWTMHAALVSHFLNGVSCVNQQMLPLVSPIYEKQRRTAKTKQSIMSKEPKKSKMSMLNAPCTLL